MILKANRKQLELFANDLNIEVDPKSKDEDLYDEVVKALDGLSDDEWDKLNEKTQTWSNELNQARIAARKDKTESEKPEKTEPDEEPEEDAKSEEKDAPEEAQEAPEEAEKESKGKGKAKGKGKGKAAKTEDKEPTKKELDAAKAKAKEKAKDAASNSKKQVTSDKPYKDGTTAWHVWMTVVDAGKKGITAEDALPLFEKRIKAAGLETSNAKSRVNTILRQCVDPKGLVTKKDGVYKLTKKSTDAIKSAAKAKKEKE